MLAKQMAIHTGAKTEAALKTANGVEVGFRTAQGESKTVTAELLLLAVGRGPVTDGLEPRVHEGRSSTAATSRRAT